MEDKSSLKSTSICSNIEENNEYDHLNQQYPNNVINVSIIGIRLCMHAFDS